MTQIVNKATDFVIIGENIHATRVLLRNGKRAKTLSDTSEVIPFINSSNKEDYLVVPSWFHKTQPYQQNQIKHFMIAFMNGIKGNDQEKIIASEYIGYEVRRQESAGSHYLDINVDEIHYDLEIQKQAMKWAVSTVESYSSIPLCIDSSNSDIILAGLSEYKSKNGPPIINSYAVERPEVLDMLKEYGGKVITMATSGTGMPQNTKERIDNAKIVIDNLLKIGIPLNDIFLDAIIFPISVDSQNGNRYLDAVSQLRNIYGNELYIGMGLSNVSFGMPKRKLINLAFIHLCIKAGINAGITDPIQTKVNDALTLNPESYPVKYAIDMLLGKDDFCMNYISAFRDGRL